LLSTPKKKLDSQNGAGEDENVSELECLRY
jgi:hypothetical protein